MKYVLIGNSTAAIGAIEGIRQVDREGEITVVSREPYHTYSRPLISYMIAGKTDEQRMKYRDDAFYKTMRCSTVLGKAAVKIDKNRCAAILDDNTEISYDRLLVATGSEPSIPPVPGLESVENKTAFMSLDDARKLMGMLAPDARVLIMGAGLTGLKCAECICGKVAGITVVDLAPRILPGVLDDEGAGIIRAHFEKKNIEFMTDTRIEAFKNNTALFSDGKKTGFDILVIAAGIRPNTGLVKDMGGEVRHGIVVNEFMQTTIKGIYAAGDCCESIDVSSGRCCLIPLLPNAYMQGECAGINMAGGKKAFDKAIPLNSTTFFGLNIATAGSCEGEARVINEGGTYKKFFTMDGLLKGYIIIGNTEKAGIYTSIIRNKTPLGDIDFDLICSSPGLMAFSKAYRRKELGGVHFENQCGEPALQGA
jgi:NAD(P)H-nitrite reductase large subunit